MSHPRILARISRDEFVGRDAELRVLVSSAQQTGSVRGVTVLGAPNAGTSEFLRQAYDELFFGRSLTVPIHFAFGASGSTADIATEFFQTFLQQYVAYRRVDPKLCTAPLTLHDLGELALPSDYEAVTLLLESFERERATGDEQAFLRFCLSAPRKLAAETRRNVFTLIDCVALASTQKQHTAIGQAVARAFLRRDEHVALGGLRRHLQNLINSSNAASENLAVINLDRLGDDDAEVLLDRLTRRLQVESNQQTRDLIVQQLNGSPYFMSALAHAAKETESSLTRFLNCQRLYVDSLMGGQIHRYFSDLLNQIAPQAQTRRTLLRVLYESGMSETRKASVWSWKKRLGVEAAEFERIIDTLHIHELANSSGATVELNVDSTAWMDYLHAQYQIEVTGEPRALIVASALLESLKRAPQAMARKYRREAALGLDELLARFDCQELPSSLFNYQRFAEAHTGVDTDTVNAALDAESDLLRVPQVVHVTDCNAFTAIARTEEKRCAVGHGFDSADYTNESEIVWIAAEIDSKLEASAELTTEWCDRLAQIARECNFKRTHLWLISPEGFSSEAGAALREHGAYSSSHRQVELIAARLEPEAKDKGEEVANEYEMVIPMGTDTELIAAHTVEQIARRIKFRPEAINQIKLALVEACINAAEHSLSPDRKIYQRFRVEDDKLVVTVASRGVVPAKANGQNGEAGSRRGWGLKLIKSLMDEVEFERVDDGTQLRMTKYLR
ncbi:MAG TPA: ATP-binding protein [Pyrinomonadaceae bacterium]|nr:ATP-binding protein [Pyrinomonadaceae bacterium]